MKKIFLFLLFLPFVIKSQTNNEIKIKLDSLEKQINSIKQYNYQAGKQLRKHTTNLFFSASCLATSLFLINQAAGIKPEIYYVIENGQSVLKIDFKGQKTLLTLSKITTCVSFYFSITAIININKAGKHLQFK